MKNKTHHIIHIVAFLLTIGCAFAAFIILMNTVSTGNSYIPFFVVLGLAVVFSIVSFFAREQERKWCIKCGASMDGCAYEYKETRRTDMDRNGYVKSTIKIIAECPECGAKKKFKKTWKMLGSQTVGDLQDEVEAYTKSKFGH